MTGTCSGFGDYPSPADLAKFMNRFRSDGGGGGAEATFTEIQVNDSEYDSNNPSLEGNVDVK